MKNYKLNKNGDLKNICSQYRENILWKKEDNPIIN